MQLSLAPCRHASTRRARSLARALAASALSTALAACATQTPGASSDTAASAAPAAPAASPGPPITDVAAPALPASAAAEPVAAAAPERSADAPPAEPAAAQAEPAPPAEPLPPVRVANIGMHIGGGPNDAPTKAPISRSVAPHFDAFRRCYGKLEAPGKGGDFGVDLRIPRDGGKASVSHPRTALKDKEFVACVVATFEAVEFEKPKGGATTVSYSLRFTPET